MNNKRKMKKKIRSSLSTTNAHVFNIGTLVFQVITLAKRQQDSPLLGFCYGFNKAF
jgi:hypothetical protein